MAGNSAFNTLGPTPGIGLGTTNYKNPFTGGGQPSTVAVPNQPQGASMPKGWSSGILGNTSLTPNTGGTSNTLTPGLLDQYKSPAPVKKLVSASGDEVHFDNTPASTTTGTSTTGTGGTAGTSTTPANNNGLFTGATTELASMGTQPGTAYTNENTAANQTLGQLQNLETLQADRTMGINNSGKGLPWATGTENQLNLATSSQEQALAGQYQGEVGQLGAANTQQGLQQNALGTAAGLSQTQVSPGNTLVSTLGNTPALYGLGTGAGGNGANAYQNFSNLQFNTSAGQQFSQQANTLQTAADQTTQNFQTLQNAAQGVNLSSFPTINAASQFLQSQAGGAAKVSALNEAYNALQTSMSNIISSGTSGLTPTQITQLTNNQNIASLSPAQLMTLYNTVQQTMQTKINTTQQQALNAEKAGTNFNNANSGNGGTQESGLYNW